MERSMERLMQVSSLCPFERRHDAHGVGALYRGAESLERRRSTASLWVHNYIRP